MQDSRPLTFEPSMRTARRADGSEIVFTRQERAILLELVRRPGSLTTRHELRSALADTGRPAGERNVDFLVNRLRKRLGDNARAPRFIGTQYGEGYVWLAAPAPQGSTPAFVCIGPVHGLGAAGDAAGNLLASLVAGLEKTLGTGRAVTLTPREGAEDAAFGLEASLARGADGLHGAFVLRAGPARQVIASRRCDADPGMAAGEGAAIATWAGAEIWRHLALPALPAPRALLAPSDIPAEIRLNEAARALARTPERWRATEAQLRLAREERPEDPALAILWGLNLFARLIHWPPEPALLAPGGRDAVEAEIEALVLAHLSGVSDNPLLKLAAAKLLFFIDRGHFALADSLAEEAFAQSTAFAAAFATRGQMLMCRGESEAACALYDRGIEMAAFGSDFHIYLLVLKATAQMAANARGPLARTVDELYLARPASRWMALFFVSPHDAALPAELEAGLAAFTRERAQGALTHLYQTSARHFIEARHRANVMAGPTFHFRRLLGPDAIPPEIAELTGPARRGRGRG